MTLRIALISVLTILAHAASSQIAGIKLGSAGFDRTQPVEITADALFLDQESGSATFDGNVLVVQDTLRLSAGQVLVEYSDDGGEASGIARLLASGGVTFVTSDEAVEAREAAYSVEGAELQFSGDVLLTQGPNSISGDRLTINLEAGSGRMEGNVRTIFSPQGRSQ
ncbi:MAG: lipopolysaccharide transport periplasmic protein LptA [Boseongicola sp.]|nr:lipopolysaccharide transport periplasmic protein LptA [Boseongicola sp.]MYH59484.1 lipopolysaccharide transport periplasmic protein LptA [Boseongicola sp. SB0675_bin_26]